MLTKEQIVNGVVVKFLKTISYLLSLIPDKELVKEIIADLHTSVDAINVETPPTQEEAAYALLDAAEVIASTTETKVDDIVVDATKAGADFVYHRGAGVVNFFKLLSLRHKAKAEAKNEAATDVPTAPGN